MSLFDPDARPIRKGKLGKTDRVRVRVAVGGGDRAHQARRARADPAGRRDRDRQPERGHAAARDVAELERLGIRRTRGRARRRVQRRTDDQRRARGPRRQDTCSSLAARNPAPDAPSAGCGATEPARRAGSVTSNAATGWTDPASKATRAGRSGLSGRSWPTTPTRSPSGSGETLRTAPSTRANPLLRTAARDPLRGRFVSQEFFRGK